MFKPSKTFLSVAASASILLSGGLAIALDNGDDELLGNPAWKRSCERQIVQKTPNGQKDLAFASFKRQGEHLGIARGSVKTKLYQNRWSQIPWSCRVNPANGEVIRVTFDLPTGSSRLMAAASYLR
jgi:hypothetical protein